MSILLKETHVDLNWLLNDDDKTPESAWPVLIGDRNTGNDVSQKEYEARISQLEAEKRQFLLLNQLLEEKLVKTKSVG